MPDASLARMSDPPVSPVGIKRGDDQYTGHFTHDGHGYKAVAVRGIDHDPSWEVSFGRLGKGVRQQNDTGMRAAGVFRNVGHFLHTFLTEVQPDMWHMHASGDEPSRVRLYHAFAKKIAAEHPYDSTTASGGDVRYQFKRHGFDPFTELTPLQLRALPSHVMQQYLDDTGDPDRIKYHGGRVWFDDAPMVVNRPYDFEKAYPDAEHGAVHLVHVAHGPGGVHSLGYHETDKQHLYVRHHDPRTGGVLSEYPVMTEREGREKATAAANAQPLVKLSRNAGVAVQGQDTKNMRALLKASGRLLSQAGIKGRPLPVVNHSDETGFRPDVLLHVDEAVHPKVLDYVAAWHGLIHGAPSVVAFNSHTSGRDRMHVIDTTHPSRTVGDALRGAGVPKFSVHGGRAYVFDQGGAFDLTQVARSLNARSYHSLAGTGRVIGAGQGADAASGRAAYRAHIDRAESDAAGSAEVRDPAVVKLARRVSTNRMVGLKQHAPQHVFDELANWTGQSVVKPTPALQVLADVHPAVAEWLGRYGFQHVSVHKSRYAPVHPATYEDAFKEALAAKFPEEGARTSWRYKHGLVKPPGLIRMQHNYAELRLHDPATGEWHQVSMHGRPGPGGDEDDTPHGLRSHVEALKTRLSRDGWHTDRVWHEDTPPQVLAQFLEDNPEHAHDATTYDTLRGIMDGTTRTHMWGQHPETGALAVWQVGHQMPFPHPMGFVHTSKVPLAVKRWDFHRSVSPESRPLIHRFPFEAHGPGGHLGVRDAGNGYSVEPHDLLGWGVGGVEHRREHKSFTSAKADAIARAWPTSTPDVKLSRPKARDVKSGLAGWEEALRTDPSAGAVFADYLQEQGWAHGEGVDTGTNPTLEFLRSGHPVKLGIHPVSGKVLAWGAGRMGIGAALRLQHPIDVEGPHGAYRVRERASGNWGYHHASHTPESDTYGQYKSRDAALRAAKLVAFRYPIKHIYRGPAGMAAVRAGRLSPKVDGYTVLHPEGTEGIHYGTGAVNGNQSAEAHRHAAFLAGLPVEGELSPHMRRIQQERNES